MNVAKKEVMSWKTQNLLNFELKVINYSAWILEIANFNWVIEIDSHECSLFMTKNVFFPRSNYIVTHISKY